VPLMPDHKARRLSLGVACHYDDCDSGLVVDFLTADALLVGRFSTRFRLSSRLGSRTPAPTTRTRRHSCLRSPRWHRRARARVQGRAC
jgi:hypothetical protein